MSLEMISLNGTATCHKAAISVNAKSLPINVLQLICSYLDTPQRRDLAFVNRYFCTQIFSDSISWGSFLEKYFPSAYTHSQTGFALYKHLASVEHNIKVEKYRLHILKGHRDWVNNILARENWLISSSDDLKIKVWDLKMGKELFTLEGHDEIIDNFRIYKEQLISSSCDFKIKIWDLKKGTEIHTFTGHEEGIQNFLPHDDKLISASEDCTIKMWDLKQGILEHTFKGHRGGINNILIYEENQLISCSDDATIKIWDLESRKEVHTFEGHRDKVTHIAIYGKQLISCSTDATCIWDLENQKEVQVFDEYQYLRGTLMYQNQLVLASGDRDNVLKIWDLEKGEGRYEIVINNQIKSVLLHENLLICSLNNHTFGIWDLKKEESVGIIERDRDEGRSIDTYRTAISIKAYRNMLAVSFNDRTIKIWDLGSQKLIRTLKGHEGRINDMIWHEDRLISCSDDRTIRIWDFSPP